MLVKKKMPFVDKFLNTCVYTVSFFLYSGFYAVLALGITIFGSDASRIVSVPIRLLTSILMIIVIIFTLFFQKTKTRSNKKSLIIGFIFTLFWALYFVKILVHQNSPSVLRLEWFEYAFYAVNFVIFPFVMYSRIPFDKYKNTILNSVLFSGFVMGLTCLYLYREILSAGIARIELYVYLNPELETLSPLALSYASVLTIMLCVYKLLFKKNLSKLYLVYIIVTMGLSLVMFLLGASRGSVLALAVSIMYLVYQSDFKSKVKIGTLILFMIPIFIWSVAASGSGVVDRTSNSIGSGNTGREKLWQDAWLEFNNHVFLGGRIEIGFYPHNIILEILMATGLLGLFIISILFVLGFFKIINLPKIDTNYIWVAIIFLQGFCQYSFSAALYQSTLIFFPLAIILAEYRKPERTKALK
ncbi:MAG: O-antigen ligase family protein [Maribacter sp.]